MLNEQKKKKKKPVKRIIDCDKSGWNNTISIQYIIDSGNLIRDVQTRYNKTVIQRQRLRKNKLQDE